MEGKSCGGRRGEGAVKSTLNRKEGTTVDKVAVNVDLLYILV